MSEMTTSSTPKRTIVMRAGGSGATWGGYKFDEGWTGTGKRCNACEWPVGISGKQVCTRFPSFDRANEDKPVSKCLMLGGNTLLKHPGQRDPEKGPLGPNSIPSQR